MLSRNLLITSNTFLDCRRPWVEQVRLARRPSSDPGVPTAPSASLAEWSERALADFTHVVVRLSPAEAPPGRGPSPAGPPGPADSSRGADEVEGSRFVRMTRTQRRRYQRKLAASFRADDGSPETAWP
ncbi:unnamed protein product [Prorocentrum cordatum]|uniref:Uncharacterized protein n=1 Tax=Prorocentrum cordatum TaxID=2364126 RepID=A0ABN9VR44_9DINO|nr:unnamed protein product [Polarella glacialis]CAK0883294.1 unnamed protein product [Polarella glacialis]